MRVVNASRTGFAPSIMYLMGDETTPGIELPTTIGDPIPTPESPLAYSETIELPELRRSRVPVALFVAAALALTAAAAGWFLLRPTATATHSYGATTSISASSTPTIPDVADPTLPPAIVDGPSIDTEHAHPPPVDRDAEFIDGVTKSGVIIKSREGVIGIGHEICGQFSAGTSFPLLMARVVGGGNPPLTPTAAFGMITAAVVNYCPQYMSKIGSH